jgi:hypothetical protein
MPAEREFLPPQASSDSASGYRIHTVLCIGPCRASADKECSVALLLRSSGEPVKYQPPGLSSTRAANYPALCWPSLIHTENTSGFIKIGADMQLASDIKESKNMLSSSQPRNSSTIHPASPAGPFTLLNPDLQKGPFRAVFFARETSPLDRRPLS